MTKATFAAGCFWGVEATFKKIKGVTKTTVGYCGGGIKNPTYNQVCGGNSGHAEALEIEFDPEVVSYKELLKTFWDVHDPTQKNRQGPDIGHQYRSAIFYHSEDQKKRAKKSLKEEQKDHHEKIATEIKKALTFYKAEEYHQNYLGKNALMRMVNRILK